MDRFSSGFSRRPQRAAARQYVEALFNDSPRKSMEAMHGRLSDPLLGLDHFEGRSYRGWTHQVVLTARAFTFLQLERGRTDDGPRPTLPVVHGWVRKVVGLLYLIHNQRLLNMLDDFRQNPPLRR